MDFELLSAIIFYSVLALIIYLKRDKVTRIGKIVIAIKSKKGITFMERIGKHKKAVKILSTISLPITFYFLFSVIFQFLLSFYYTVSTPNPEATVAFVVPGVRIPGSPLFFPFWYTIIAIMIVAVIHEFSHGIVAVSEDVPIKSSGFGLFFIFFIAFVDPDEKKMEKASNLSRIRIASAGPMSNIVCAFLIFYLLSLLDPLLVHNFDFTGIRIAGLLDGYPAQKAGIPVGAVITSINNNKTLNMTQFTDVLFYLSPNSTASILTDRGLFNVTLAQNPNNASKAYIGVNVEQAWKFKQNNLFSQVFYAFFGVPYYRFSPYDRGLLWWVAFIGFFVGLMNLLPIFGLDGGIILYSLCSYIVKNKQRRNKIVGYIFTFFTIIFILTIILPYIL